MQGRVVTASHQACRAIPDSFGHDRESLCQGTPQKWASAYFVARLSSSHRELLCLNAWRHQILADSVSKPWREQGESLSRALFPSQYCGGAHRIHSPLSWDSRKHLARTEKKARTCTFGSICFSVPFRKLVSGWSNSGTEHRGIKQYLGKENIHNSIPPPLH